MPEAAVTMQSWVDKAQNALVQARDARTQIEKLTADGSITEARRAELNATYVRAFSEAKDFKSKADAMKGDAEFEQLEAQIAESRAAANTAVHLHPRAAAAGAQQVTTPAERQIRTLYTAEGEAVPNVAGGDAPLDRLLYEARHAQLMQFSASDLEMLRNMPEESPEVRSAFNKYLHARRHEHPEQRVSREESRSAMTEVEARSLSPYTDGEGGYIMNREMRAELIRQERNLVQIRKFARVIRTNATSIAFPAFKSNISMAKMRANQQVPKENISKILGKVSFTPHEYDKIIQVPQQLVEDATFAIVSYLAEEIALQASEDEETMFISGSGSSEALGVLSAPIYKVSGGYGGISVPTGQVVTPEDIKQMPYNIRAVWRKRATWMTNRFAIAQVAKFRTNVGGPGTGEFLFQMGLQAGQPDTLGGYAVLESEFFPNAFATGAATGTPVMLFGDWNQYWIVDRLSLTLQRLDELYAETSQIGFKYRKRVDGAPVRTEAFCALVK